MVAQERGQVVVPARRRRGQLPRNRWRSGWAHPAKRARTRSGPRGAGAAAGGTPAAAAGAAAARRTRPGARRPGARGAPRRPRTRCRRAAPRGRAAPRPRARPRPRTRAPPRRARPRGARWCRGPGSRQRPPPPCRSSRTRARAAAARARRAPTACAAPPADDMGIAAWDSPRWMRSRARESASSAGAGARRRAMSAPRSAAEITSPPATSARSGCGGRGSSPGCAGVLPGRGLAAAPRRGRIASGTPSQPVESGGKGCPSASSGRPSVVARAIRVGRERVARRRLRRLRAAPCPGAGGRARGRAAVGAPAVRAARGPSRPAGDRTGAGPRSAPAGRRADPVRVAASSAPRRVRRRLSGRLRLFCRLRLCHDRRRRYGERAHGEEQDPEPLPHDEIHESRTYHAPRATRQPAPVRTARHGGSAPRLPECLMLLADGRAPPG